jgi:ribonuclease VapC
MSNLVDTSAVVALLTGESIGGPIAHAMESANRVLMSASTLVELGIVLETRLGPVGTAVVERFVRAAQVQIIAVDREGADLAIDGWRRYGKGRHRAGLTYRDSFVYSLATNEMAPVLCVGDDFARNDLTIVDLT